MWEEGELRLQGTNGFLFQRRRARVNGVEAEREVGIVAVVCAVEVVGEAVGEGVVEMAEGIDQSTPVEGIVGA